MCVCVCKCFVVGFVAGNPSPHNATLGTHRDGTNTRTADPRTATLQLRAPAGRLEVDAVQWLTLHAAVLSSLSLVVTADVRAWVAEL